MKKGIIIATLAALLASAAGAYASTPSLVPNVFGWPGTEPALSANCHRATMDLPENTKGFVAAFQTVDAELKCENRRINRLIHCAARPLPTGDPAVAGKFDHGPGKPGDWTNVDGFQAYVDGYDAAVTKTLACMSRVTGTK